MQLRENRSMIPIAVGLIVALIMLITGRWLLAAIILAVLVVALFMQRRADSTSRTGTGATSAADIDALLATASSSVAEFNSSIDQIANPTTKEIASKIGTNLTEILAALQQPDKRSAAPVVIDNLIEPAQSTLTEYLFLTKKAIATTTPRSSTIEKNLVPQIESASRQTLSLLQEAGKPDLAKLTRATTIQFEQTFTMPPTGATARGSREIDLSSNKELSENR